MPSRAVSALSKNLDLAWLIRLRWVAVAAQAVVCVLAVSWLKISLPLFLLAVCFGVTIVTNLVASRWARADSKSSGISTALLLLDTVTLTVMLYWTGGAHNPFTAFYLLHITIAAMLLSSLWAWISVALCGLAYGSLFLSPHALASSEGATCCGDFGMHLQGMLVAMVLTGGCIAFFVSRLNASLLAREAELQVARARAERNERFASLATLAAGVAHEMATPLGTIAVASKELQIGLQGLPGAESGLDDARLIRAEVDRCRAVLEKLSEQASDATCMASEISVADIPQRLREYLNAEHRDRVRFHLPATSGEIAAPEVPLLQSLAVVIKNGLEASDPADDVTLEIRTANEGATFVISDHGAGMPEAVAARIGEPFFTTKEPGEGMGLGLFLVRMFVERVRGRLEVESAPARGTTMRLFIPRPTFSLA